MKNNIIDLSDVSIVAIGFANDDAKRLKKIINLSQNLDVTLKLLPLQKALSADVILINCPELKNFKINEKNWDKLNKKTIITFDQSHNDSVAIHSNRQLNRPIAWGNMVTYIVATYVNARLKALNTTIRTKTSSTTTSLSSAEVNQQLQQPPSVISKNTLNNKTFNSINVNQKPKLNILLIDDSESIRNILSNFILQKGYAVKTAANAAEGKAIGQSENFDCILLDVVLPDQDGYEVCKFLKAHNKNTPVVMLTSKSSNHDKFKGKMAGCDAYLTKPTTATQLFETISNCINS